MAVKKDASLEAFLVDQRDTYAAVKMEFEVVVAMEFLQGTWKVDESEVLMGESWV